MKSSRIIQELRAKANPENVRFVSKNLDISREVNDILKDRGLSQKEFASKLGKNESEISKWLSGLHNITLKSIAKMEAILNTDIIITPQKAWQQYEIIKYVPIILERIQEKPVPKYDVIDENVVFDEKCLNKNAA